MERPDYNADGVISFEEAHAYTLIASDTIDIPMKTSGEFLSVHSKFGKDDSNLLSDDEPFSAILRLATPSQKAVLTGLSKQLELTGDDRVATALRETENRRGQGRGRSSGREITRLRDRIATDLKTRWPELDNVLNPLATELLTARKTEFIDAIETHPEYQRYRELKNAALPTSSREKRRAKFNRFIRTADNVVFAENLRRIAPEKYAQYLVIVDGESRSFTQRPNGGP